MVVWMVTVQLAERKGFERDEALLFIKATNFCCFLYGKMNFIYLILWSLIISNSWWKWRKKFFDVLIDTASKQFSGAVIWVQCSSYVLVVPYVVENCVRKIGLVNKNLACYPPLYLHTGYWNRKLANTHMQTFTLYKQCSPVHRCIVASSH